MPYIYFLPKGMIRSWFMSMVFLPAITVAQIKFAHYKTEDGLPHDFTFQVYQSDDGYLWIGTDDGLAKFNGKEFKVFNHINGFRTNFIIDMKQYKADTMAIGVWKGGLHFLKKNEVLLPNIANDSTERTGKIEILGENILSSNFKGYYTLYKRLDSLTFIKKTMSIYQDNQGNTSLNRSENNSFTHNRSTVIDNKLYFYRGIFSWDDTKLLKGIYQYNDKDDKIEKVFPFFENEHVNSVGEYGSDMFYATINDDFYVFNSDGILRKEKYNFKNNPINTYAETSYCKVFIVNDIKSGNDLIYIYDKNRMEWKNLTESIGSKILFSAIYVDVDENIWITSRADGVYQLSKGFDLIKENILGNNYITDIAVSEKDAVFFLKRKQIYRYDYKTKEISSLELKYDTDKFEEERVQDGGFMLEFSKNKKNEKTVVPYKYSQSKKNKNIIKQDKFNCFYKDVTPPIKICLSSYIINNSVVIDDELWLGTSKGILVYGLEDLQQKKIIDRESKFKNLFIQKIVPDPERGVWIIASGNLYLIKRNNEITRFDKQGNLGSTKINDVFLDHLGVLWIGTQKGFSIYKNSMFYNFENLEKLRSSFVSRIVEDSNHQIWVSGNKGVVRIDNRKSYSPKTPPRLIVNQHKDVFELDVIDYSGEENTIQYRSYIKENWKVIESKVLDVNNYAIGNYNLQFRARNPHSDWAYSKEYPFKIKQKWYKEVWFIASIALITTIIAVSYTHLTLPTTSRV